MFRSVLHKSILVAMVLFSGTVVSAQVMQSTNYRIQDDSINIGGGHASSSNYVLEDTMGEIATGDASSTNYVVRAGYQQMQESYLSLNAIADVTLTPSLGGVTGGISNGSTTIIATTDNYAGYQMTITASQDPAMQDANSHTISDYTPSGGNPDFSFSTSATQAHLGFSPEGTDIISRFKDNGASCNTGSGDTAQACWDGLSTTPQAFASRSSANHPTGTETTIRFRVGIGGSVSQPVGTYTATTTVTLTAL